ncbi:TolC family protein [Dysgonomonas sp. 216]|uniref:TolC family protein n=1 Tax=Dysgonomonas sp. 216 TaxID=2302934 RepID=UPI0013D0BEC4|nr:TolC family protein [Dysgonomonas sp. 216]NDW18172.1 TolC family protein [Dysgonomonas sp. 216]
MKKKVSFLFFSVLLSMGVYSQRFLTLEDCRNLAIENNKALKLATEQERVAYYQKKDALTKYFPDISFQGAYLRNEKNLQLVPSSFTVPQLPTIPGVTWPIPPGTEVPMPDAIRSIGEIDIKNIWVGGFSLTQPLFMGGKIIAYNDIESYAEELAKSQKDTKLKDVIVETDNAYWQVVSLATKKELADSYVDLLKKMERDITLMENEGVATKADVLSVNVKLNEAEVTQTKVENGLSLSKMLLNQICGLDIQEKISLRDENIKNLSIDSEDSSLPNIEEAIEGRSEIKSLELARKMYKKKENIAFSEFLPQVAFTANYLWTNPSAFNGLEKKFGGMWNVGVVVKVPLNFVSSSSKLNVAKAQTNMMGYQLDEAKEKIELQINQSAYKLNEANKKLIMTEKNMEKADENLRYANAGFEEGVIPASDALAAHTAWISAHSEFIDAQIDVKLCKVYLDKALGRNF